MTRNSNLSSTSTSTFRRRNSPRNSSTEIKNDSGDSDGVILPSRIPIKSPARPSNISTVGGMAVAYSPRSDSSNRSEISAVSNKNLEADDQSQKFNDSFYARKLVELRNAMEMLKTPPSVKSTTIVNDDSNGNNPNNNNNNNRNSNNNNNISYTPIKSSGLVTADYSFNDSNNNNTNNYYHRRQSSSSFFNLADEEHDDHNLNISYNEPVSMEMLSVSENDASLLDAYNDEPDFDHVTVTTPNFRTGTGTRISLNNNNNFSSYSSPNSNSIRSSPYISSDELRHRLQATREAFQKSLEAQKLSTQIRQQKRHLSSQDLDSCFSTCDGGFDSDLSTDTLRDTRKLLNRIKREAGDLIESDLEDVSKLKLNSSINHHNDHNHNHNHNHNHHHHLNATPFNYYNYTLSFVLYFGLFIITFSLFTFSFMFINYSPISSLISLFSSIKFKFKLMTFTFKNYFRSDSFLEKCEEFINYLLQDDDDD